jgi:hypothetical protein
MPTLLSKKPITKAEVKFMKGVKIDRYECSQVYPGGNCNGGSVMGEV